MKQHAAPAGAERHFHDARWRVLGLQIHQRLTQSFTGEALEAFLGRQFAKCAASAGAG